MADSDDKGHTHKQEKTEDSTRCRTCGKPGGRQQVDNGLRCGVHHDKCFEEMVSECRRRSW